MQTVYCLSEPLGVFGQEIILTIFNGRHSVLIAIHRAVCWQGPIAWLFLRSGAARDAGTRNTPPWAWARNPPDEALDQMGQSIAVVKATHPLIHGRLACTGVDAGSMLVQQALPTRRACPEPHGFQYLPRLEKAAGCVHVSLTPVEMISQRPSLLFAPNLHPILCTSRIYTITLGARSALQVGMVAARGRVLVFRARTVAARARAGAPRESTIAACLYHSKTLNSLLH